MSKRVSGIQILLVDSGNTYIKLYRGGPRPTLLGKIPSDLSIEDGLSAFSSLVNGNTPFTEVLISSVKSKGDTLIGAWCNKHTIVPRYLQTDIPIPLITRYKTPETLGIDRQLLCCAFIKEWGHNGAVIGVGTAITIDIVKDGVHEGGSIAPGGDLLGRSLADGTGALPPITMDKRYTFPGKATSAAIGSGCQNMVDAYLSTQIEILKSEGPVVITGGGGRSFARRAGIPYRGSLVAQGMWISWQECL